MELEIIENRLFEEAIKVGLELSKDRINRLKEKAISINNVLNREAKNYKAFFEDFEEADAEFGKIVKMKDGWHVVSEKTGKSLGGPYKTRKEAVRRLRQVEFYKHQGQTEEELANLEEPELE